MKNADELEVHHIIEKRLLKHNKKLLDLFSNAGKRTTSAASNHMPSTILKKDLHAIITKRWASALAKKKPWLPRQKYSADDILKAAKEVYHDMPDLRNSVEQTINLIL